MMFCPNSSNQLNPSSDGLIRMNGWSQVVPICMPWATTTATHTQTPIASDLSNTMINGHQFNQNIMQFTANTQPINLSLNPPMISALNPNMKSSVIPIQRSDIDNEMILKSQRLCADPCTSQTATRWELLNNISTGSQSSHQHLKRRNDSSDEEFEEELRTPLKQHISEDKVSAIFNKLQITNNDSFVAIDTIECEEFEDQSNESNNSMVFADELQTAIRNKTITDRIIQNELEKHSKAVVLWQPITLLYPPIGQNPETTEEVNDESESDFNQNISSDLDIDLDNDFDNDMELCL